MASLILRNATVITLDPALPEAEMIVVRGGRILAVSRNDRLREFRTRKTTVIDCRGKTVIPGFVDAHLHFCGWVSRLVTLDLSPRAGVRSISTIQERVKRMTGQRPPGNWIRAGGYDEFHLAEKRHPTRWDLDAVSPLHPVKLTHRSGHAHVLNSLALERVGISERSPDPQNGLIDRSGSEGAPTGVLYGMGPYLAGVIPPLEQDLLEQGVRQADAALRAFGITSFYDPSVRNDSKRWEMVGLWKEQGLLKCRVSMGYGGGPEARFGGVTDPPEPSADRLDRRGVKIVLHETTGRLQPEPDELNDRVWAIHRSGQQVVLHAVEERAVEAACGAVEAALKRMPRRDHRHRIEHASICRPGLAKRMAHLGIVVVTQPGFVYHHGDRYVETVSREERDHLYPIATLLKAGVHVAAGSDCPVAPADPIIGIASAVSRRTEGGKCIAPGQAVTPLEAVRLFTETAAVAIFAEGTRGSIRPGKWGDLVVLSDDLTRLPSEEIGNLEVDMTVLAGEVVWDRRVHTTRRASIP